MRIDITYNDVINISYSGIDIIYNLVINIIYAYIEKSNRPARG